MSQKLLIQCPNCNARLALPNSTQSEFAVGCPKCQLQFRVQNPAPLPATTPAESLERLEPVPESPIDPNPASQAAEVEPPAPIPQAENPKPARLVRAVPVDDSKNQSPPSSNFQQPHIGATQLPIDSKGNFKGSVTKRDLPNFDFEATNAKFELHANAPGSKPTSSAATEKEEDASPESNTQAVPQPVPQKNAEPVIEPSVEEPQAIAPAPAEHLPATETPKTVASRPQREHSTETRDVAPNAGPAKAAPSQAESPPMPAPAKAVPAPSLTDAPKPIETAPVRQVPASRDSNPAQEHSSVRATIESLTPSNATSSPAKDTKPVAKVSAPAAKTSDQKAKRQPKEKSISPLQANARERADKTVSHPLEKPAAHSDTPTKEKSATASPASTEKQKLAEIAAMVSRDEGGSRKGRRGKRGRRNKNKNARASKAPEAASKPIAEKKPAMQSQASPVLREAQGTASSKTTPTPKPKPEPTVDSQTESRVLSSVVKESERDQDAAPVLKSAVQAKVAGQSPAKSPATGSYSEQKSSKQVKKKPVKKARNTPKSKKPLAKKKQQLAGPTTKNKKKEQDPTQAAAKDGEPDWASYQYLAQRSDSRKKQKMIVSGVLSFLALCFTIWAVVKADLFKELSRPDKSDSQTEVAVDEPIDSSHPFVNLYIKILQARIESLEQLSPTAEAMISFRQKNPLGGDIEYLLEKAVAEEPAPREARELILSDLSKLESQQQQLENDLLKGLSKGERRKWERWQKSDANEPKELVADLQLCFKSYCTDGLFSLPVPAQEKGTLWLCLEETQVMRNCLKSLVTVEGGDSANYTGTRLFKEADALFANAIKRTEAKEKSEDVPQSYKEFLFAAKMARNVIVNRLQRRQLVTPTLKASLDRLDAAHEAFRLAQLGKTEAEVRAAFKKTDSSVANLP